MKTSLLNNSRFYILVFSVLVSVIVFAYLRVIIEDNQLLAIRTQQVYGLLSVAFLYCALIISPLGYLMGKKKIARIAFARRAIGVSAFYFALLHGSIALLGQLGGANGLTYLPDTFKWALIFGLIAFIVLGIMAATSFDKVVRFMTFPKWKWLHRLVYAAVVLLIIHVWLIGTHMAYGWVQLIAVGFLAILFGLELYKFSNVVNEKYLKLGKAEAGALFLTLWAVAIGLLFALPALAQNYHSKHTDHTAYSQVER